MNIHGKMIEETLTQIGDNLRSEDAKIATAESCTGGFIAHLLTKNHGSSDFFQGSLVAYQNIVKIGKLGVKGLDISKHGVVSQPVVESMAEGVCDLMNGVRYAVATTGYIGDTKERPEAEIWIAVTKRTGTFTYDTYSKCISLSGNREENIHKASEIVLEFLVEKFWSNED